MKSNSLQSEHNEIKQSETETQWNQTVWNQNTLQSNNLTPEHCCQEPASRPVNQPDGMSWLFELFCFFLFCSFHGFQKSLLKFTKHYTRTDLRFVFHFGICFVMVFDAFNCFCCQIITYVSLNEFLVSGASHPTSRPARWDELAGWVFFVVFFDFS